jgi:hypothetical protein
MSDFSPGNLCDFVDMIHWLASAMTAMAMGNNTLLLHSPTVSGYYICKDKD